MDIEEMINTGQLNWFLIIVGAIVLSYMLKGAADGFIRTVFEAFSVLAAAAAASFTAPYINNILKTEAPLFSFLAAYMAFWLLLKYVCAALDLISKLPVINELNKAAGVFAGLLRGIFMVWILFIVVTVFQATAWGGAAIEQIERSRLLERLYDGNLLLKLAKVFF